MPQRARQVRTCSAEERVEEAGFVVAAFITVAGAAVFVIATLTTIACTAAGDFTPEAPIVAALGLLAAGVYGAIASAWQDATGIAAAQMPAPQGTTPETTPGPLRA